VTASDDAVSAQKLRAAVLAPRADPAAVRVDPDVWYIAQSNTLRRLHLIQLDLSNTLDAAARTRQVRAQVSSVLTGTATGLLVLLAFSAAVVFGVRTSRRLRTLRRAALAIAHTELPGAISALSGAPEPAAVRNALHQSVVHADQLTVAGADEIGEVGHALGAVHRQALRLAADQALLRLDVAGLFVALSRRGQSLIHRQLQLIDEFERNETDQDRLGRLYALDHLAARMRRNEENLLVLAGGEPGRRVTAPAALHDVIELAAAETEDPDRIDAPDVAEVGIAAPAVRDVVHLLAELLENAIGYSPPTSRVQVSARRAIDGTSVTVFDEGIGMPAEQVTLLNDRLRRTTTLTAELAGTMGLLVVARLAARHGIQVELRSALGGGTAALVSLPGTVLTIPAARPESPVRAVLVAPAPVSPAPVPSSALPPSPVPSSNGHQRGLPRRRPGDLLLSGSAVDAGDLHAAADPNLPPDPEIVRARLSGLASGLAEAARHTQSSS
jgi:signal transduction histidine kinase